jgi:hypothetical protein
MGPAKLFFWIAGVLFFSGAFSSMKLGAGKLKTKFFPCFSIC